MVAQIKLKYSGLYFFLILCITVVFFFTCKPSSTPPDMGEGWVPLFNGKNLSGWTVKIKGYDLGKNFGNTFRAKNGIMRVGYEKYDQFDNRFGHIFYKTPFSDYHLKLEYRFLGDQVKGGEGWAFRNSGIMVHAQSAQSMLIDQDFPISVEAQILGGDGENERSTMNLCTPGTHVLMDETLVAEHCIPSSSITYHGNQWVSVEMIVNNHEKITHIVEGDTVLQYIYPQMGGGEVSDFDPALKKNGQLLSSGYIALQSESHPIEFRNIYLKQLHD